METSQEAIGLGPRQKLETSEETTNKRYYPAEYENGIKLQQRHNEIMRKREAPLRTSVEISKLSENAPLKEKGHRQETEGTEAEERIRWRQEETQDRPNWWLREHSLENKVRDKEDRKKTDQKENK